MKYGVKNLYKNYDNLKVLDNLNLEFKEGAVTCILGPSGCGKTTLLNILSGAIDFDSGEVLGFKDESISYVFQEDRLIEWKTVKENLEFVLKDKMPKDKRNEIITSYLKAVDMLDYIDYYPNKLSGGMRQRVAIIRAFTYSSKLLIMDEPFKSLDMETKQNVMDCFINLRKKEKRTCIIVTHDINEAKYLGDELIMLSAKPSKVI
ncbi:ABC transporter ATP-binding protein [Clostridium sp. CS001]|uniref:ABC transporter ATP-binding protein n=1 Tax=Clostridium sp. CS001 TaxID=2880648 RepID=UPI001CF2967E|nr:ABC transporter ATP-binding protein [Clostridium sp. CS001]MCB2290932.1 ABC transporter ATP-binding protein [Clostridium sp. CS001]